MLTLCTWLNLPGLPAFQRAALDEPGYEEARYTYNLLNKRISSIGRYKQKNVADVIGLIRTNRSALQN